MFFVSLISLIVGCWMLWLCVEEWQARRRERAARFEITVWATGFVCVILTSFYALTAALIWIV